MPTLIAEPLTRDAFAPFGQVIQAAGAAHDPINGGRAERFHDLAQVEVAGAGSQPIISIFRGKPSALPHSFDMVERHPLGSQAFYPLSANPFLVIVAPDDDGAPGAPRAFLTGPGQGVNIAINTWHGVLTPLIAVSEFLIVDRGGVGSNLEEFQFEEAYTVLAA